VPAGDALDIASFLFFFFGCAAFFTLGMKTPRSRL